MFFIRVWRLRFAFVSSTPLTVTLGHYMNRRFLLVTALTFLCAPALSLEPNQWVVTGIGNDSCASYVLALTENRPTAAITYDGKTYFTTANAYTQWVTGFVTATNLAGKPGSGQMQVDVNGIALWVKQYCEANPSASVVMGAGAFIRAHRPKAK